MLCIQVANPRAVCSVQVRDPGYHLAFQMGYLMSISLSSSWSPLSIVYLCFHDDEDVIREIPGKGEGNAQRQVHVDLAKYLSLCSILKGVVGLLAFT